MVARGDLGAELPIQDAPILQVNVHMYKHEYIQHTRDAHVGASTHAHNLTCRLAPMLMYAHIKIELYAVPSGISNHKVFYF